jgi:hypothetical protein
MNNTESQQELALTFIARLVGGIVGTLIALKFRNKVWGWAADKGGFVSFLFGRPRSVKQFLGQQAVGLAMVAPFWIYQWKSNEQKLKLREQTARQRRMYPFERNGYSEARDEDPVTFVR